MNHHQTINQAVRKLIGCRLQNDLRFAQKGNVLGDTVPNLPKY